MDDELFFLYQKYNVNPSFLEDFIYRYLYNFKNINEVDKVIVFHDRKSELNLNQNIIKKLKNARIFNAFNDINGLSFFHITHSNVVEKEEIDILNDLLKNYKYELYKDKYCEYSITFTIFR